MWSYTCLMLYAYVRRTIGTGDISNPLELQLNDFAKYVFEELLGRMGVVFHDSEEDLEKDLEILSKLEIISYDSKSKTITITLDSWKLLSAIAEGLRKDPMRTKIRIVDDYVRKIENTIPT